MLAHLSKAYRASSTVFEPIKSINKHLRTLLQGGFFQEFEEYICKLETTRDRID